MPASSKIPLGYGERTNSGDKKENGGHGGNRLLRGNEGIRERGRQITVNHGKGRCAWNQGGAEEETLKDRCFDYSLGPTQFALRLIKIHSLRKGRKYYKWMSDKLKLEDSIWKGVSATMVSVPDVSSLYWQNKDKKLKWFYES